MNGSKLYINGSGVQKEGHYIDAEEKTMTPVTSPHVHAVDSMHLIGGALHVLHLCFFVRNIGFCEKSEDISMLADEKGSRASDCNDGVSAQKT
ncbi:Hypothetical predicted protein, partial [Pelobates cultripes]